METPPERADALDYAVVRTPDGVTHARIRDVPILLCGRAVPDGAAEFAAGEVECGECHEEARLRGGDRSIGVVDA